MLVNETDTVEKLSEDVIIWTEKDMGEPVLQFNVCGELVELLRDYSRAIIQRRRIGGNLLFRYDRHDPAKQVTPDVYVLADEPDDDQDISCWSTWERGDKAPLLAVEVVSKTSKKDYALDPKGMLARYQALGVGEVVRYDPLWGRYPRSKRRLLTHWVRSEAGVLEEQALEQPNMVLVKGLGIWLVHISARRLRIGQGGPGSMAMWPTRLERIALADERSRAEAERAEAQTERADAETERADSEAERAEAETERAEAQAERAEAAESELKGLREELRRLKEGRAP